MSRFRSRRSASLAITLFGAVANLALTIQVLSAWRSLKWESESEWEGSHRVDGVKLVWGLLSAYFAAASFVSFVGFTGVVKSKAAYVRFYRDSFIADFAFTAFFTLLGAYGAFQSATRTTVCEELSRQPELMRDMAEMGLNLENCELWFDRALLATLAFVVIIVVIRLHFLLAVSNFYSHLVRHQRTSCLPQHNPSRNGDAFHRVYLLPPPSSSSDPNAQPNSECARDQDFVYAPVPLSTLSPDVARDLRATATAAWISHSSPDHKPHTHRHRHHSSSSSNGSMGRISLPINPDEGLLPRNEETKSLLED